MLICEKPTLAVLGPPKIRSPVKVLVTPVPGAPSVSKRVDAAGDAIGKHSDIGTGDLRGDDLRAGRSALRWCSSQSN